MQQCSATLCSGYRVPQTQGAGLRLPVCRERLLSARRAVAEEESPRAGPDVKQQRWQVSQAAVAGTGLPCRLGAQAGPVSSVRAKKASWLAGG